MFANNHHQHTTQLGKTSHVLSFPKLSSFQNLQKHKTTQNTTIEHTPFQASTIIPSPLPSIIISILPQARQQWSQLLHISFNWKQIGQVITLRWPLLYWKNHDPCFHATTHFVVTQRKKPKKIIDLISISNISKAKKVVAICKPNLVTLQTRNSTTHYICQWLIGKSVSIIIYAVVHLLIILREMGQGCVKGSTFNHNHLLHRTNLRTLLTNVL
jgi:hypothetical protein